MGLTKTLLGITGVITAILFQAWSLPVFLLGTVLVSKCFKNTASHRNHNFSVTDFKIIARLMAALIILVLVSNFFEKQVSELLDHWDKFSIFDLSIAKMTAVNTGVLKGASIKFALNITALVGPLLIAFYFEDLLINIQNRTSVGWKTFVTIFFIFLFLAFFPLWWIQNMNFVNSYILRLVLFIYLFHPIFGMLFFKLKP